MKFLFSLLLVLSLLSLCSIVYETASLSDFIYGSTNDTSYDNWLSHTSERVLENSNNSYAPFDRQLEGFGDYYAPEEAEEEAWSEVVNLFLAGNLAEADLIIEQNQFPFETVIFSDLDTDRTYHVLREILNNDYFDDNGTEEISDDVTGSFDFGWGIYIHDPESTSHVIVNVVHPNDDFIAPPVAVKAFQDWNARYLFIDGTGREVAGSNQKSDPSRNLVHPFNTAYFAACDLIREDVARRELSVQIHSYDWNRHEGYASCQVSAGKYRMHPNLPIRDESNLKRDLINLTNYLVVPQNSIGSNQDVLLDDYYSVYHNCDFTYQHFEEEYDVNDNVDLPGYSSNIQMLYTSVNTLNPYDVQEPFFHIEMDELPNCYSQFEIDYNIFYGIDLVTGIFNQDHIYDYTISFYTPWVDAFTEALVYLNEFDDGSAPAAPANLHSLNELNNYVNLVWNEVSDYDFESYEILYAEEPIGENNYEIINREDNTILASQDNTSVVLSLPAQSHGYYIKIRAKDYNGNISSLSEEIFVGQPPATVTNFNADGLDGESYISWEASWEDNLSGFTLYRSFNGSSFSEIASYTNNISLQPPAGNSGYFEYIDSGLDNYNLYTYKLTASNSNGLEYENPQQAESWPAKTYSLHADNGNIVETIHFSSNCCASYYYDSLDVPKGSYDGEELYFAFVLDYGAVNFLGTNVIPNYDFETTNRNLKVVLQSNTPNSEIDISTDYFTEDGNAGLYLKNLETNELHDFSQGGTSVVLPDTSAVEYMLVWGELQPYFGASYPPTAIFKGGDQVQIDMNIHYHEVVSNISLYMQNDNCMINLMDGISPQQDSVVVVLPAGFNEHNMMFRFDFETYSGNLYQFYSMDYYGLIDTMQELVFEQGWQTFAYPFLDDGLNLDLLFGDDNLCYNYTYASGFQEDPILDNLEGNLLYFSSPATYFDSQDFQSGYYSILIDHGWNLIPNRFPLEIETKSIILHWSYWSQAISENMVTSQFVVYEDGEYKQVSSLKPFQAGFIFYNGYEQVALAMFPYGLGMDLPMIEDQHAVVSFEQSSRASVKIGFSAESVNEYDPAFDLPAYPELPGNSSLHVSLIPETSNNSCPYDELYQEFLTAPVSEDPEQLLWHFELTPSTLEPIVISLAELTLAEDYKVVIQIDNIETDLNEMNYVYLPTSLDTIVGQLYIRPEEYTDLDDVIAASVKFTNYPNPFNPNTVFSFSLMEEESVNLDIYNVKGQKIKSVINEVMPMGMHEQSWDGYDDKGCKVASGVYISRLRIGCKSSDRKLLLLK